MFPRENLQFIPNKDEMRKTNPAAVKISTLIWQSRRHRRVRKDRHRRLCYSKTFDITAEKGANVEKPRRQHGGLVLREVPLLGEQSGAREGVRVGQRVKKCVINRADVRAR